MASAFECLECEKRPPKKAAATTALRFLGGEEVELGVLEEHDGFAVFDFAGENHLKGYVEI